jgi:hypothetical protein
VHDTDPDGRQILNATDTEAAREKATAMQDRFADWVWEDPDRARRLAGEYNRRFNALVLRDYTTEGDRLVLPGLARTFTPRAHQRAAVARMISEPAVGLFHQVGAGKTAEMVMGVMELRRLGMAAKPVVVVPNHMLEQFSREWLQLYPQARVLAASTDDLTGDKRREFVARTAANDWDAVVMTRSAFERIPVSRDALAAYLEREAAEQRAILDRAKHADGAGLTVKRLEKAVMKAEERHKALLDGPNDPGLTWEATGIDYLVVDEAHDYKNLTTTSNITGAAIEGSKRASDLHMKAELLRTTHGHRVITVATATPIANSVTEAHVMQRYLRPDLLRDAGVEAFDSWAATFGQTVTEMEMAPAGGGAFRQKTRFAKFQNVPEMLRMWQAFADVKTADDLNLPAPPLARRRDGQRRPEMVVIPPSEQVLEYVRDLGRRADLVAGRGVEPDVDNMLKISTDGRKAALDIRLVHPGTTPAGGSKVTVAADRIAGIYHHTKTNTYRDPVTGLPHPVPGALQLVFCDLSTPPPGRPVDRVPGTETPTRHPWRPRRPDPVHARRPQRRRQGQAVRRRPRRARRRADGLHPENGRRHQRAGQSRRPAPPRLPLAPGGPGTAGRPDPAAGQPEPRGADHPVLRGAVLRRLLLANRGTQGPVHRAGHARPDRRPRHGRRRRQRPVLRRGQGPRLR